nr:kaempferol 3-o-beta-d-galactosyltransferase [Quercus suber]
MWNSCSSFRPFTSEGTAIGKATYKNVYSNKIYVGFIKVHPFSSNYAESQKLFQTFTSHSLNTQKSNHSIFSTAKPDEILPNIKAYNVADGVPAGHVLSPNPIEAVELFIKVSPQNFKRGLEVAVAETGKKISCLISDAFLTFALEIAEGLHVPWIPIWLPFPCSLSAHVYTDLIRQRFASNKVKDATLEFIPGLSQMRVSDLPEEVLSEKLEESTFSLMLSQVGLVLPRASAVVLNFYEELNPPLLNRDFKTKFRNVLNVGLFTLSLPSQSDSDLTGCISCNKVKDATLEFIPGLSQMRVSDLPEEVLSEKLEESTFSLMLSQVGLVLPRASAVVLNFYEELNPPLLNRDFKTKFRNVLNVGLFPLSLPSQSDSDLTGCISWLDGQKERSVAYVSFGTVASPPQNELIALAEALEESGIPFLWSLKDNIKSLLPKGFVERTGMQGKIVPWTPQVKVLAHSSIAVFMTHCGSNSVSESVVYGVPLICRPFFGDHHMTGRMVEEVWGVGVKVEGGKWIAQELGTHFGT